jgi:hypothetical protein
VPVLHADGRIFRAADSTAWRWAGVSAFRLLHRHAAGENIRPFLDAYAGYGVLRVFTYALDPGWGARAWDVPTVAEIKTFCAAVAPLGWLVELTLLTDDMPDKLAWAQALVPQLAADPRPTNLLLEGGNEPDTHKHIDTAALRSVLEASGFLYASGNYEQSAKAFGRYGVAHTARTADWPRRGHDLMEYYQGGGPNAPTDPAHPYPWVGDEPGKPQDVGTKDAEWLAYFGVCALLGAGATFHCETGKYGDLPTEVERHLAAVALSALRAFPADAPNGPYRRIVEPGQSVTARTYVVGSCMVRSQQAGTQAPEPGWTPIDTLGVLWRR